MNLDLSVELSPDPKQIYHADLYDVIEVDINDDDGDYYMDDDLYHDEFLWETERSDKDHLFY